MSYAISSETVAVVTGGAAGIGLACACRFGAAGGRVAVLDIGAARLRDACDAVRAAGASEVLAIEADVADLAAMQAAEARVTAAFGGATLVMANAGIQPGSGVLGPRPNWERIIAVNLWGVINTVQAFVPGMIERGQAGAIICTGSKQGITTPPGDPAYNVAKAGVKAFAEALAHDLRNREGAAIDAHLLIPGFVFTGLTRPGGGDRPAGAWVPDQVADFLMAAMRRGEFYVLCPDNDVDRATDEKRIAWAAGDIIENRPPLSRWHPEWAPRFADWMKN